MTREYHNYIHLFYNLLVLYMISSGFLLFLPQIDADWVMLV